MIDPNQTRALVIDDQAHEGAPVIQALQLLGINSLFYDGGIDFPFAQKLCGPRLLLLDMVLGEHGARMEDTKLCNGILLAALERAVDFGRGPLLVIGWTAHPEMMKDFQEAFVTRFPAHSKTIFLTSQKPSQTDFFKQETLGNLKKLIQDGLKEFGLVGLLIQWESLVQSSAKQTTNRLFELGGKISEGEANQEQVLKQIDDLCGILVFAEGGTRAVNGSADENIRSFFNVLHPLLVDRLEHTVVPPSFANDYGQRLKSFAGDFLKQRKRIRASLSKEEDRNMLLMGIWEHFGCDVASSCPASFDVPPVNKQGGGTQGIISALNTMLLLSNSFDAKAMQPGNLYLLGGGDIIVGGSPFSADKVANNSFLPEDVQPADIVLIECSPSCDFAQNKRCLPRCVAGLFVSEADRKYMPQNADFLRFLGPVLGPKSSQFNDQPVWLVINSHFVTSITPETLKQCECIGRLRNHALMDVMSWLAGHMSRPGYASI
jgi:hypothetical protein